MLDSRGIIVAADVDSLSALRSLVRETGKLEFIAGYKIGIQLVGPNGFGTVSSVVREETDALLIYDHQKWGTDIPEVAGGPTLAAMRKAGFDALIIFPLAGIQTLMQSVEGCHKHGLLPVVGGEMTHPGFLSGDGGYIEDGAPTRIYADAARAGVSKFVVPGTKADQIATYGRQLGELVGKPAMLFPGVGKGQGGDIVEAFKAADPHPAYAIVGRGIYAEPRPAEAAARLWSTVESAGLHALPA